MIRQKIPNSIGMRTVKRPEVRSGIALRFDTTEGARYGSFASPITGGLTIDPNGAKEFGFVAVIWSGSTSPVITGHDEIHVSGEISRAGVHTVYLHWIDGRVNVTFFTPNFVDQLGIAPMTLLQTSPLGIAPMTLLQTSP